MLRKFRRSYCTVNKKCVSVEDSLKCYIVYSVRKLLFQEFLNQPTIVIITLLLLASTCLTWLDEHVSAYVCARGEALCVREVMVVGAAREDGRNGRSGGVR